MSEKKKGTIKEGLLDKEFESFMGLDKERNEKPKVNFIKDRTNETRSNAYLIAFRRTFHFLGYSSKQEFFYALLYINILLGLTSGIGFTLYSVFLAAFLPVSPFFIIFSGLLVIANLSLFVRRMADAGYNRLIGFIPLLNVGLIFSPLNLLTNIFLGMLSIVLIIILALKPTSQEVLETVKTWESSEVEKQILNE